MYIFRAIDKIRLTYEPIYTEDNKPTIPINDEGESSSEQLILPKVLGKIDLSAFSNDDSEYEEHFFSITEDELLFELNKSELWANKYGSGFVGRSSFVLKYLGNKGYDYKASFKTLDKLISTDVIEQYTYTPDDKIYNEVQAIRLKKK